MYIATTRRRVPMRRFLKKATKGAAFCFVTVLLLLAGGSRARAQQSDTPDHAFSVTPHVAATPVAGGYVRLRMVRVVDQTGLTEPTEALRMLIPADWKFEGQVRWLRENVSCPENMTALTFRAASPDQRFLLERFPEAFWTSANNAPRDALRRRASCPLRELVSAEDYFSEETLRQARPGAHVLAVKELPEFSNAQKEQMERADSAALSLGNDTTASADSVRINYEYLNDGQMVEEAMVGTIFSIRSRSNLWPLFGKGPRYADVYAIHAGDIYVSRAPEKDPQSGTVLARILVSLRGNPRWSAGRDDVLEQVLRKRLTADDPLPTGKTEAATKKKIAESYRRQEQSHLTRARLYDAAVRPMQSFVHPLSKAIVELNGGFAFAWCNDQDEYILTNDASFNPATQFRENWRQLEPAAPAQP